MTSKLKLLAASSAVSLLMLGANPALAAGTGADIGTDAGVSITNNVSVNYNVGGAAQVAQVASDTFVVDRKINLLVDRFDTTDTSVTPGQTGAAVAFKVTNQTNDTIDILLSASQAGSDQFDSTGAFTYYLDVNQDGILDGGDTLITGDKIENLAEDTIAYILVTSNIPLTDGSGNTLVNGDRAGIILTAQAADATTGTAFTNDSGTANVAGTVQNVFADTLTTGGNIATDGKALDTDYYLITSAMVSATKTSIVVWDPINLGVNPKAIPGAIVEYCILLTNTGSVAATNLNISDALANVAGSNTDRVTLYQSAAPPSGAYLDDANRPVLTGPAYVNSGGASCTTAGTISGALTGNVVSSGEIPTLAATTGQASMIFRATIQ